MARVKATFTPGPAMKRLVELDKLKVVIGVLGAKASEQHDEGGGTVVNVATIHEFGAPEAKIPERSFLRATVRSDAPKIAPLVENAVKAVVEGRIDAQRAYRKIGEGVVWLVKDRMQKGISPPLKRPRPRTKTQRAADKRRQKKGLPPTPKVEIPLINTSQLIGSIAADVRRK